MKDLRKDYLLELLDEAKDLIVAKNVMRKYRFSLELKNGSLEDRLSDILLTALMVDFGYLIPKGLYKIKDESDIIEWLDENHEDEYI